MSTLTFHFPSAATTTHTLSSSQASSSHSTFSPSDNSSSSMDNSSNNSSSNNQNNNNAEGVSSVDSGVFIYAILLIGFFVVVVYFAKVFLAKRRYRRRAMKDPDYEGGPPMYLDHLEDLQVIETPTRTHGDDTSSSSSSSSAPSVPASALIRGENYYIVTPRTINSHSRTGSAASARSTTHPITIISSTSSVASPSPLGGVPPPAYEDLSPGEISPQRIDSLGTASVPAAVTVTPEPVPINSVLAPAAVTPVVLAPVIPEPPSSSSLSTS